MAARGRTGGRRASPGSGPRNDAGSEAEVSEASGSRPVPEAWIGRAVKLIFVSGSSTEYADGYLEEVNDRGIVLTVEGHGEYPARPLFFPWGAVIQLSAASDG
jgi:hypothetical protein